MGAAGRAHLELMVTLDEAVIDEGNGQRQQHNPAHHTQTTQHTACHCYGVHVPVAHGRHGDDDPPTCSRDAGVVLVSCFQVEAMFQQLCQCTEDCHGNTDEDQEHHHFAVAASKRQAKRLQAQEVTR